MDVQGVRWTTRALRRRSWVLALLAAVAVGGCSNGATFRSAMYPRKPTLPPAAVFDLTAAARLTPLIAAGFDAPGRVAACFREAFVTPPLTTQMSLSPKFRERMGQLMEYAQCVDPLHDGSVPDGNPNAVRRACARKLEGVLLDEASGARGGSGGVGPRLVVRCDAASSLSELDQLRAVRALTDVAEAVYTSEQAASGQIRDPSASWSGSAQGGGTVFNERHRYELAVQRAIALGVELLAHDPTPDTDGQGVAPTSRPVLALSGGAANGAFTAGYLHALLALRQRIVESAPATERPSLEAHHRIGTIAGTSVGSLVSLLVDLYFAPERPADPTAPPLPKRWFPSCDGDAATMTVDTNERCALDALEAIFNHTDESDLLCVERGNALELVTSQHGDDHLLRFDPLRERLLVPFFARFGEDLVNNDLVRITVAVDLTQNAALGLDERACRLDPAHTQACLLSAVMTSISEPVFVPPVRRVYSGLYPHEGEGSPADASTRLTWFDGGLRSGTPADFALLRAGGAASRRDPSWSRVLAITTTPLDGVAKTHPRNGLSTFFDSTFDAVDQVRRWEIAHAQLLADARAARLTAFGASRPPRHHPAAASPGAEASPPAPAEPPTVGADAAALEELAAGLGAEAAGKPTLRRPRAARVGRTASPLESASVLPVFVPATMEPRALFAAGYQFDPLMMQGLYLWGELTFLESYERVLRFLRWDDLVTERPEDVAWLTAEHARVSARLCEQFGVSEDCHGKRTPALASDEALKRHYRQRRRAMRRNLAICDDTCPAFPAPRSTCERR